MRTLIVTASYQYNRMGLWILTDRRWKPGKGVCVGGDGEYADVWHSECTALCICNDAVNFNCMHYEKYRVWWNVFFNLRAIRICACFFLLFLKYIVSGLSSTSRRIIYRYIFKHCPKRSVKCHRWKQFTIPVHTLYRYCYCIIEVQILKKSVHATVQ